MTPQMRKERRKTRKANTRLLAYDAYQIYMKEIGLKNNSFHQTPTKNLAALVKSGRKIAKLRRDAIAHLDKRHARAKGVSIEHVTKAGIIEQVGNLIKFYYLVLDSKPFDYPWTCGDDLEWLIPSLKKLL